jgi:hypothetical protein
MEPPARHAEHMFASMNDMYKEKEHCDVILDVGGRHFQCHKAILAAASSYFKCMFCNGMAESRQDVITLHDVDPKVFSEVLNFIYTGEIASMNIFCDDGVTVKDLVKSAVFFDIGYLQNICIQVMDKYVDASNWYLYRQLYADMAWQGEAVFPKNLCRFIADNFEEIYVQSEFLSLDVDSLIDIISSSRLDVQREETVFEAVMMWLAENPATTHEDGEMLLEHIRFPLMSSQYVCNEVEKYSNEKDIPRLKELVNEAKMCHLLPGKKSKLVGQSMRGLRRYPMPGKYDIK